MSGKFHVNTATGDIGPCRAKAGKCPFGEENHYDSLVAAAQAYEAEMESDLSERNVHWNPRTLKPAMCYTSGCSVGVPKAEHFRSWAEAIQAQEVEWRQAAAAGTLKGKHLTSAATHTSDPDILLYVTEKGTAAQVYSVLYRRSSSFTVNPQGEIVFDGVTEAMLQKTLARGFFEKKSSDCVRALPSVPTFTRASTLRRLGMHSSMVRSLMVAKPRDFLSLADDGLQQNEEVLHELELAFASGDVPDETVIFVSSHWTSYTGFHDPRGAWHRGGERGPLLDRLEALQMKARALKMERML